MAGYDPADYPLVYVCWVDAEGMSGWHSKEDFDAWAEDTLRVCHTVGWLIAHDEDKLIVASTLAEVEAGDGSKIPSKWIKRLRKLLDKNVPDVYGGEDDAVHQTGTTG